jgi:hypothetical protein
MNARSIFSLILHAAFLAGVLGCNDSSSSGSTAVTLSGIVSEGVPGSETIGDPVSGVEVCQFASNNCATSDETGFYALRLLKNQEIELTYLNEGFGPVLVATTSGVVDFSLDVDMARDSDLSDFFADIDSPYPPEGSGYLSVSASRGDSPLAGVSYSLAGSSGRSFYVGDDGVPDTSLQETQMPGVGGFVEVLPLTVTLSISGAVNCASDRAWPAPASGAFRLPMRAGFWTQSAIDCE